MTNNEETSHLKEIDLEEGPGRMVFQIVAYLTHAMNNHLYGHGQVLSYFLLSTVLKLLLSYGQTL